MLTRHTRVHSAPHICAGSASRCAGKTHTCLPCPICSGRASRIAGETHTPCPSAERAGIALHSAGETHTCQLRVCHTHRCGTHFTLCRRETYILCLPHTYVLDALNAVQARHARVSPAQHICSGSASRYEAKHTRVHPDMLICAVQARHARVSPARAAPSRCVGSTLHYARETHTYVCTLLCTYVQAVLRAMQARHTRVRLTPLICWESAPRYAGETRTCLPRSSNICRKCCSLCSRDTYKSAQPRTYMREARRATRARHTSAPPLPAHGWEALRAMQTRHARVSPFQHTGAGSAWC